MLRIARGHLCGADGMEESCSVGSGVGIELSISLCLGKVTERSVDVVFPGAGVDESLCNLNGFTEGKPVKIGGEEVRVDDGLGEGVGG